MLEPSTVTTANDVVVSVERASRVFSVRRHGFERSVQKLTAVDDVSFEIHRGECFGLVGESGCGKSTLARLILNLVPLSSGRIVVAGADIARVSGAEMRALRRRAQIVFQDPYSSLDPRFTVEAIVAEGLWEESRQDRRDRVRSVLDRVGLPGEFADRYPHQLSGGQRQRVSIARALAVDPDILVLDEPVSALDVSMQAQVLNLLRSLQDQLGLTYLFISHDLSVVRHVADRVGVMYLGKIVEAAETDQLFEAPAHPYTHALLSAIPSESVGKRRRRVVLLGDPPSPVDPPDYCRFSSRCFRRAETCLLAQPPLDPVDSDGTHRAACFFPGPLSEAEAAGTPPAAATHGETEGHP